MNEFIIKKELHIPITGTYILTFIFVVLNSLKWVRLGSIKKKCISLHLAFKRYQTSTPISISIPLVFKCSMGVGSLLCTAL